MKLAIIGASYLQVPLIQRAKEKNIETHVFAWECGDPGEVIADHFYPISIVEKDLILSKCQEIGIDGVCTIASDLAAITVNYIAAKMNLIGNSLDCTIKTTNKVKMRKCFEENSCPSPKSIPITSIQDLSDIELEYPLIIKPSDRSGSRGITKITSSDNLAAAINYALDVSFDKTALIEEFADGDEYSVECFSYKGEHTLLTITKKYTTGSPNFIETAHLEPAPLSENTYTRIENIVLNALSCLGVEYGASHSEIKINSKGEIKIIEIGARMGGDHIGAKLVNLSTGYDFLSAVIDIALGNRPQTYTRDTNTNKFAAIRYIFNENDITKFEVIRKEHPEIITEESISPITNVSVTDSSTRFGYYIISSDNAALIKRYIDNLVYWSD